MTDKQRHHFTIILVSIHTPTKGVTYGVQMVLDPLRRFNPHTHEGCDNHILTNKNIEIVSIHTPTKGVTEYHVCKGTKSFCFNPHTHEGCDLIYCNLIRVVARFQSTHPRRVWQANGDITNKQIMFQSTHPRRVWPLLRLKLLEGMRFQSTHPRRVWLDMRFTVLR